MALYADIDRTNIIETAVTSPSVKLYQFVSVCMRGCGCTCIYQLQVFNGHP